MLATNSAILSFLVSPTLTLCLAARHLALPILSNTTSLLGHFNETAVGSLALNLSARGRPYCSALDGDSLNLESCENAWLKVPVDTDNHVFRHRNENPPAFTISLPLRYLSDDGKCAIDFTLKPGWRNHDEATGYQTATATDELLETCVARLGKGGIYTDFTADGQLKIIISSFESQLANVYCGPEPSPSFSEAQCENALMRIPTSRRPSSFRTSSADHRPRSNILPMRIPNVVGPLFVNMPLDIPPTTESWLRIWEAGVALFELCVKNHLGGIFNGLGANKQISISLGY